MGESVKLTYVKAWMTKRVQLEIGIFAAGSGRSYQQAVVFLFQAGKGAFESGALKGCRPIPNEPFGRPRGRLPKNQKFYLPSKDMEYLRGFSREHISLGTVFKQHVYCAVEALRSIQGRSKFGVLQDTLASIIVRQKKSHAA